MINFCNKLCVWESDIFLLCNVREIVVLVFMNLILSCIKLFEMFEMLILLSFLRIWFLWFFKRLVCVCFNLCGLVEKVIK